MDQDASLIQLAHNISGVGSWKVKTACNTWLSLVAEHLFELLSVSISVIRDRKQPPETDLKSIFLATDKESLIFKYTRMFLLRAPLT